MCDAAREGAPGDAAPVGQDGTEMTWAHHGAEGALFFAIDSQGARDLRAWAWRPLPRLWNRRPVSRFWVRSRILCGHVRRRAGVRAGRRAQARPLDRDRLTIFL